MKSALGGAGGALMAVWGTRALVALAPHDLARQESIAVDWRIATGVIVAGALLGLLAGTVPATWAARAGLDRLLSRAAVRGGGGHGRLRRGLVVLQVALSMVLLVAGGLVVRSFDQLLRADPGFEPAGVLTLRIPVPALRYPESVAVTTLLQQIHTELAGLPGVASVGAITTLPLSGAASQTTVAFPGAPGNTGDQAHDHPLIDWMLTRPGYFDALGIRVLAGRVFETPLPQEVREAVIDETLATTFFPNESPVGATLNLGNESLIVVGVVDQARLYDIHRDDRQQVYMRHDQLSQFTGNSLSWALRTHREPLGLALEARAAIRKIDPELAVSNVRSMEQIVSESVRQERLSAVLITGFALGALFLAGMGLFGVVSGSVTRRRHEIAVRLALGAEHGRVLRRLLWEGAVLILVGLLIGVPGSYVSGRAMRGVLVGVSPFDPLTLASVACGLTFVALVACYIPARRATRIDPAELLRDE